MQLPDYHGGSIVNLMASLQAGLDGPVHAYQTLRLLPPEQVAGHRQVLLWVVDGLGLNYLRAHPQAACLNAHLLGGMTSVYPPTTASAVTTFLTGDAPQQHGLTGWHMYFRELGSVLAVLPVRARYGGAGLGEAGIDVAALLGHVPFAERIGVDACSVSPAFIARSEFNLAHLGRARGLSYRNLPEMLAQIARALDGAGRKYVYAYWPELDSIGHHQGIRSEAASDHLMLLDRAFETLLEQLRGSDTLVVVCADHGQIDTTPEERIELAGHPRLADTLILPLCGEPRSVYCYLRPGCEQRFDEYVSQEFAGFARCFTGEHLLAGGWFGLGEPHAELQRRVGDRVLLMNGHFILKDWLAQEKRHNLIGVHGGLSEDELHVPLVVAST
jgi:Type I phosphodiesterase / nucleotide pyrophosphatase